MKLLGEETLSIMQLCVWVEWKEKNVYGVWWMCVL